MTTLATAALAEPPIADTGDSQEAQVPGTQASVVVRPRISRVVYPTVVEAAQS